MDNLYNHTRDIRLQKILKKELTNDCSSSYSQNEKAHLIARCNGNILIKDINGFRAISKEEIGYLDINKYEVLEKTLAEENYKDIVDINKIEKKILQKNERETSNIEKSACTTIVPSSDVRNLTLSFMENIQYFLFQSEEEIEFINTLSSSSGLGGYGLNLI